MVSKIKKQLQTKSAVVPGAERGIWTLAPVSRPTPLAGEPLHHLGISACWILKNITPTIKKIGAEGGIRTHVTVKSNGFQDRLVMTASIPLRVSALLLYHAEIQLSRLFFKKITQLPWRKLRDGKYTWFRPIHTGFAGRRFLVTVIILSGRRFRWTLQRPCTA